LALLGAILAILAFAGCGAAPRGVPHIGYLLADDASSRDRYDIAAFPDGLRQLGYVDGQNIRLDYRFAGNDMARLPALAAELVAAPSDVIVASGTQPTAAAKAATSRTPIVMTASGDPVGSKLVASLALPGGNVTGVSSQSTKLTAKALQLLKKAIPQAVAIGVLWNPADNGSRAKFDEVTSAARTIDVQVRSEEVGSAADLPRVIALAGQRDQALLVVQDALLGSNVEAVVRLANTAGLPAMYQDVDWVEAGGLMSYGVDHADLSRRAAVYVDRILKGASPAELPVEQPARFPLMVNLRTAARLRIDLPGSFVSMVSDTIG
jgi:putative ABC transport system substrate-binding protein